MNTHKHYSDPDNLPESYNYFSSIHTVDLDTSIKPLKAFASMISGESYHVSRFNSEVFRAKLIEVLHKEKFDIVQLETLYLAPYVDTIREYSDARIVMRAHNVEHEIWERITRNETSNLRKAYLAYLTRKLRDYEIGQLPAYDYLVTLTERDLQHFLNQGYKNGATAAPIGFDMAQYPVTASTIGPDMSMCFIGSLDWMPNREGLNWFLQECWPKIHSQWPSLSFHVAGRNTPQELLELKLPKVFIHGEVADASEFVSRHTLMLVPLFSGSGMRVKIVEGMMLGKVVVSTTLGKEGIEGEDKKHFLVADTADEFIQAIGYCIQSPEAATEIGRSARTLAATYFDSEAAARKMLEIYRHLMTYDSRSKARPAEPAIS
jgi:glycosyltransferase involved in cell wall biosynthesis